MAMRKPSSLQGLRPAPPSVDLNDPNLTDEQWLAAAHGQGAQLGGAQWLEHTQQRRNATTFGDTTQPQDPMAMSARIREEANAQFTDPTGALGFFLTRQDPLAERKKKLAASALALHQVI